MSALLPDQPNRVGSCAHEMFGRETITTRRLLIPRNAAIDAGAVNLFQIPFRELVGKIGLTRSCFELFSPNSLTSVKKLLV
jgi:hypothetical protein